MASSVDLHDPKFFEYRGGGFVNALVDITFGWFKTLDEDQKESYDNALFHAATMAENGQEVRWMKGQASGSATPVYTWPTGSGYCRRIYVQALAHGVLKNMTATACYDNAQDNWRWISLK